MAVATKAKAKYKVGDYVVAPTLVYREILVALTDGPIPIYGARTPKNWDKVAWYTEFEFDDDHVVKGKPDFALWKTVVEGDVIKCGNTDDRNYIRVLARVADTVLVSEEPQAEKVKQVTELSDQIKKLTEGSIDPMGSLDKSDRDMLRKIASTTHASKIASGWMTIEYLALMNWQLIRE